MALLAVTFETVDLFLLGSLAFAGGAVFALGALAGEFRRREGDRSTSVAPYEGWPMGVGVLAAIPILTRIAWDDFQLEWALLWEIPLLAFLLLIVTMPAFGLVFSAGHIVGKGESAKNIAVVLGVATLLAMFFPFVGAPRDAVVIGVAAFALAFLLGRLVIRVGRIPRVRRRGAIRREIVQRDREEEAPSEIQRNVRQLTVVHGRSREETREVIENAGERSN